MSPLVGRVYVEALRQAGSAWPARIRITLPPRARFGRGELRLVAVRPGEWILAYEDYSE